MRKFKWVHIYEITSHSGKKDVYVNGVFSNSATGPPRTQEADSEEIIRRLKGIPVPKDTITETWIKEYEQEVQSEQ